MAGFLSNLFSKERSVERKLNKFGKKLHNIYVQTQERQWATQQLADIGTPEAIKLLLQRFEKRVPNHTLDREEKIFVHDLLIEIGDAIVEPTIRHLKGDALIVNWPLRILSRFLTTDEIADLVADLLEKEDTEYTRHPQKKHELVLSAIEYEHERLGRELVRMMDDTNEQIRYLAVDGVLKYKYPFGEEPVMKLLAGDEESQRIITLILDQVVLTDWKVTGHRSAIEESLPEGYAITRSGTIRRRGA